MVSLRQLGKQNRPEDMHPADVDRLIDLSEESAAEYRERIKMGEPSKEHLEKFRCEGCDKPLGNHPAFYFWPNAYHLGCAEKVLAARKNAAD